MRLSGKKLIAMSVLPFFAGLFFPTRILAHDNRPDPPPQYGGVVFTSGTLDVEVVMHPGSPYQVYFWDSAGAEVPAAFMTSVGLVVRHATGPAIKVPMKVDEDGKSWIDKTWIDKTWTGKSPSSEASIKGATLTYEMLDIPVKTEIPLATSFHGEFQSPKNAKAGEPVALEFAIKDFFGQNTQAMDIVHEMPMHLMVVSSDLAEFHHIHPAPIAGGIFRVSHVFQYGGDYKLYADYTPTGANGRIEGFDLKVEGPPRPAYTLAPTQPQVATVDGMRMTLRMTTTADKPLRTGQDINFAMTLVDAKTGAPIHDLQRYLGAWSHIAVVSQDLQDFIHVHPFEDADVTGPISKPSPDTIRTATGFRRPGLYKWWAQVERGGKVTDFPFVFRVEGSGEPEPQVSQIPPGAVLVGVRANGFEPALISAVAGKPLKLAFFRPDAQNCAREVIFPDLGIQRELPVGETTVVEVTPRKTGSLSFSCGMKMLRGELIVR